MMSMKTIITTQQVVELAYVPEGVMTAAKITIADIVVAESKYLIPIIGESLYDALMAGSYTSLCEDYVAPMVAAWTRYVAEPLLAGRLGVGYDNDFSEADNDARDAILMRLRHTAAIFSRRLSDYLNAHSDQFPEYNPIDNPLNHCMIDGGIVQIF